MLNNIIGSQVLPAPDAHLKFNVSLINVPSVILESKIFENPKLIKKTKNYNLEKD